MDSDIQGSNLYQWVIRKPNLTLDCRLGERLELGLWATCANFGSIGLQIVGVFMSLYTEVFTAWDRGKNWAWKLALLMFLPWILIYETAGVEPSGKYETLWKRFCSKQLQVVCRRFVHHRPPSLHHSYLPLYGEIWQLEPQIQLENHTSSKNKYK